jgi:G:T/U-mismatch repair DNA glycosylase
MIVKHKFINFENSKDIEILILGTFNPDTSNNEAEFFYGRTRNFLWNLLPKVYGYNGLKYSSIEEKLDFIKQNKIGFIDLIAEIQVDEGQEKNYSDSFIDSKVIRWNNIINLIDKSKYLKNIYLTRKTFTDIPEMKKKLI